ncbi:hypothetical protein GCM10009753_45240 [Streptantibioticus ferralitis]
MACSAVPIHRGDERRDTAPATRGRRATPPGRCPEARLTGPGIEFLALPHQLLVLQHQVGKPRFTDTDRAFLAGLLHHLPMDKLRHLLLLVRPDTILRWHRDLQPMSSTSRGLS